MGIRCADHVTTLYPQKLALTSPTGGGRSVGIVRSRTKATEECIEFLQKHRSFCKQDGQVKRFRYLIGHDPCEILVVSDVGLLITLFIRQTHAGRILG